MHIVAELSERDPLPPDHLVGVHLQLSSCDQEPYSAVIMHTYSRKTADAGVRSEDAHGDAPSGGLSGLRRDD